MLQIKNLVLKSTYREGNYRAPEFVRFVDNLFRDHDVVFVVDGDFL